MFGQCNLFIDDHQLDWTRKSRPSFCVVEPVRVWSSCCHVNSRTINSASARWRNRSTHSINQLLDKYLYRRYSIGIRTPTLNVVSVSTVSGWLTTVIRQPLWVSFNYNWRNWYADSFVIADSRHWVARCNSCTTFFPLAVFVGIRWHATSKTNSGSIQVHPRLPPHLLPMAVFEAY